ncbi:hypothetical protein MASR1M12_19120 [Erysipelotrichia bacterium]
MNRGDQESVYKQVTEELQLGKYDLDIWEIALAESGNDENIALVKYKLLRVRRLLGERIAKEEPRPAETEAKIEAAPDPIQESQPEVAASTKLTKNGHTRGSYIMTTVFYFLLILVIGYVNKTLTLNEKVANDHSRELAQFANNQYNEIRNEWHKLVKSRDFKKLPAREQDRINKQYDAKLLAARVAMTGGPDSDRRMRETWNAQTRVFIATLICQIGLWFSIFKLAGHLKLGCLTTVLLVAIPIVGWIGIFYVACQNCRYD